MHHKTVRLAGCMGAVLFAVLLAGCGDEAGNQAVRDEVKKGGGASASSESGAFGKVSETTKLPPQGKPPEPGAVRSGSGRAIPPRQ